MRVLVWIVLFLGISCSESAADRPNVILMMCDDLGWGDAGFNGGTHIRTPHLDQMAKNSLILTRFYAQAPVCSPTRASVVTGRYHDRTGIYTANNGLLRDGEFTIYEALSGKGYATGHFGKWHMGTLTREVVESNRGAKAKEHFSPPWNHTAMEARPKPLGFHIRGQCAWHDGDMKAYRKSAKSKKWELYDLGADPKETNNLAAQQPEKLQAMVAAWTKWKASVDASDQGGDY